MGYFSDLCQQYIEVNHLNIYGSKLLKPPFPQYVVFYNGSKEGPDRQVLKLSDSFEFGEAGLEPSLECKATMLNINYGHNKELMERSVRLRDYSLLVFKVREYAKAGLSLEKAVDTAVADCIRDRVLADVLAKHRAEVCNLILYEYDEQKQREIERYEAREEVRQHIVHSVLETLEELGRVPEDVRSRIAEEKDLNLVTNWLKKAARADTLEDFFESFP